MPTSPLTPPPLDPHTLALIRLAVREDLGHASYGTTQGDLTANLAIPQSLSSVATLVARAPGIIAGTYLLPTILREYHVNIDCSILTPDSTRVAPNQPIAQFTGPTRALLSAERVLLNFLSHLSGIATLTRTYVDTVAGTNALICDTRKTTPAYRTLDKYAVRCGGGTNHRIGLYDGVMLKDNHLAALRNQLGQHLSLAQLTSHLKSQLPPNTLLWLEVDTLDQLQQELTGTTSSGGGSGGDSGGDSGGGGGGADIILLDNMTPDQIKQAVQLRNSLKLETRNLKLLEASGGITLTNLREIAETGIDRISIGALTHSAPILDLSMEIN